MVSAGLQSTGKNIGETLFHNGRFGEQDFDQMPFI